MSDEWAEEPPTLPPGYRLRTSVGMVATGAAAGSITTAIVLVRWLT